MQPIGVIHSPFTKKELTPIQPARSKAIGKVEIYPEYEEGLDDIDDISYIILIYYFHKAPGHQLKVKPFLDNQYRGLFATRYPSRPNQIGISIVRLLKRTRNILEVEGIDVLDQTPLLDIKPYVPDFDIRTDASTGWYNRREKG